MFEQLQRDIHYSFNQVKYLETALTHSSFCNENDDAGEHNERLEFLGDAVLELSISSLLYQDFPEAREGQMTTLRSGMVNQGALARMARRLNLDQYLKLGRGEESQGGRQRETLLSDVLEALLGAVFLDGGFECALAVVERLFKDEWPSGSGSCDKLKNRDNKSMLQELSQKLFQDRPVYALTGSEGPEHAKIFRVSLSLPDGSVFYGSGASLKKAEQNVAGAALAKLLEN